MRCTDGNTNVQHSGEIDQRHHYGRGLFAALSGQVEPNNPAVLSPLHVAGWIPRFDEQPSAAQSHPALNSGRIGIDQPVVFCRAGSWHV